jgi:hypothetical protein
MRAARLGVLVVVLSYPGAPARAADYAVGADLSFLKQAEDRGTVFKDEGKARPALQIFKDHGYNWVRLRLFHSPKSLPHNLDCPITLARASREQGFEFLLDFHYPTPGSTGQAVHARSLEGQVARGAGAGGLRVHGDTIAAFRGGVLPTWCRSAAGHQRHALARRQATGRLGQLRRPGEGRCPGRRGGPWRRPRPRI